MLAKRLDLTFSYLNSAVRRFLKFPPRTSAVLVYTRNFAGSELPLLLSFYDNFELVEGVSDLHFKLPTSSISCDS
jgi:hypothetical protein